MLSENIIHPRDLKCSLPCIFFFLPLLLLLNIFRSLHYINVGICYFHNHYPTCICIYFHESHFQSVIPLKSFLWAYSLSLSQVALSGYDPLPHFYLPSCSHKLILMTKPLVSVINTNAASFHLRFLQQQKILLLFSSKFTSSSSLTIPRMMFFSTKLLSLKNMPYCFMDPLPNPFCLSLSLMRDQIRYFHTLYSHLIHLRLAHNYLLCVYLVTLSYTYVQPQ